MTDKAAPKAKAKKKDKETKVPGPKLVSKDINHGVGHNSNTGEKNPEATKCLEELMALQAQKKTIARAERDIRNRLKSEFSILASSVSREISLRKLDPDVRVQVETNHEDFKKMVGYQPSLDFVNGVATEASQKAQARETEPNRAAQKSHATEKSFSVEGTEKEGGVITREG